MPDFTRCHCRTPYTIQHDLSLSQSCIFSPICSAYRREIDKRSHTLPEDTSPNVQIFTRAHVRAKTRSEAHNISSILSDTGPCWHSEKAPIYLCHSGRVLGLSDSPSVAHVVPSLLVNYNFAYGCLPSCTDCPILCLGESCVDMLYWSTTSQLAG